MKSRRVVLPSLHAAEDRVVIVDIETMKCVGQLPEKEPKPYMQLKSPNDVAVDAAGKMGETGRNFRVVRGENPHSCQSPALLLQSSETRNQTRMPPLTMFF